MQTTDKFGLPVPEPDDLYDIAVYAQALAILDTLAARCTGVSHITALTKAEYDALDPPDPSTIYLVTQTDGTFSLYLGTIPSGGSSKVVAKEFATVYTAALTGTVGNLEEVSE